MYAVSEQMQYDPVTIQKLERICIFNALIYIKVWLNAPKSVDAPANDLNLFHTLNFYAEIDREIAEAAQTVFHRHFWYVTEEVIPLALFSSGVSDSDKKKIATALLRNKSDTPLSKGTPVFPNLLKSTKLPQLVGPNSWLLFNVTGHKSSWLKKPTTAWADDADFLELKKVVKTMKSVNDAAERGIKLMQDFSSSITKNEGQRQDLLQVVEQSRRTVSSLKKSKSVLSKA